MPRLVYPFTIVGASAGWLAVELLDNPITDVVPSHAGGRAALCSGVIAALLGLALQRRCAPREAFVPTSGMWVQVTFAVLLGGASSGAATGALAFGNTHGVTSGILAGLAAALVFLPVCMLVVAAARRAARARLGSLVAGADRRELWALMLAALAVTTGAAFPEWMAKHTPIVALALAASALLVILALFTRDLVAVHTLRRAAQAADRMELRDRGVEEAEGTVPSMDLGLGDEVRAHMARTAAAYRGRDRAASLLVGSLDTARGALREALVKKALAAAVAIVALAGHSFAARPRARIVFHEIKCERGSALDCGIAAAMLREGGPDDLVRAVILGTHACDAFRPPDKLGCVVAAEMIERDPARADRPTRQRYRERACMAGDIPSCRMVADFYAGDADKAWSTAAVLQRACEVGDMWSCENAVRARSAAFQADAVH
ncbi:hypothetical protein A7982_13451 [Minicystis rosea]|nr:hypothetical protein A7982_13451 [Minicystis rosea]